MAVNYNRLADRFDERYEHQTFPGIQAYLRKLVGASGIDVLEVGCGTGHWLSALRDQAATLLGIDPSAAMLDKARSRAPGVTVVCGSAEALPFSSNLLDLVFCVNAFHHFSDPKKFLEDCRLVLRKAGRLVIIGLDPHVPETKWYLYDYFPGVKEKDLERYLSHKEIGRLMTESGFQNVVTVPTERIQKTFLGKAVLGDPFLERASTSQLQLISESSYLRGKGKIASLVEDLGHNERTLSFDVDLTLFASLGEVNG